MEYHGDEDVMEITKRDMELALEVVVATILDYGQYPAKGRAKFDLYDFLLENRDPSYAMEMYVASLSSNTQAFKDRIYREGVTVEKMLVKHLTGSDLVADLAAEYAEENK
jgi:hypothetical protein